MQTAKQNLASAADEPIYVYFDYNGVKVSELFIPTESKKLTDLITENSVKYNIPKDKFLELVIKNKINLSENNYTASSEDKKLKTLNLEFTDRYDKINTFSTRGNLSNNHYQSFNNNSNNFLTVPNTANENNDEFYKAFLSYEKKNIPKQKLFELTSELLNNTNKYLKQKKNLNIAENLNNVLIKDKSIEQNKAARSNIIDNKNKIISPKHKIIDLNNISNPSKRLDKKKKAKEEAKSPNYQFINPEKLLLRNHKHLNSYADKDAYARQLKENFESKNKIKNTLRNVDTKSSSKINPPKFISQNQTTIHSDLNKVKFLIEKNKHNQEGVIGDDSISSPGYNIYNNDFDHGINVQITSDNQENNNLLYKFSNINENLHNHDTPLSNLYGTADWNMNNGDDPSNNINYEDIKNNQNKEEINNNFDKNNSNLKMNNNNKINSNNYISGKQCNNIQRNCNDINSQYISLKTKTQVLLNKENIINYNVANKVSNRPSNNNISKNADNEKEDKLLASENFSEKSSFFLNKNSINYDLLNSNSNSKNKNTANNFLNPNHNNNNIFVNNNNDSNSNYLNISNFRCFNKGKNSSINIFKKTKLTYSASKADKSILYGERLFHKGLTIDEKKDKKAEHYKRLKQEDFQKNCTFKPKLNPNSLAMNVSSTYSKNKINYLSNNLSTPNILYHKNNINNANDILDYNSRSYSRDMYRNLSEKNIYARNNCIKHTISRINTKVALAQTSQIENHNNNNFNNKTFFRTEKEIEILSKRLFDNAERYRNKKLKLKENYYSELCTFSPHIKREDKEIPNMDNFFARLQNWVEKRNEKYEYDLKNINFDGKTGNRLFSPQINKSSKLFVRSFIIFLFNLYM